MHGNISSKKTPLDVSRGGLLFLKKGGHIPYYEALMKDIALLLNIAKKNFKGVPLFLYRHSFRGNQVLNYALRYHPYIAGIIVSAPWLSLYSNPSKIKLYFTYRVRIAYQ